MIESKVRPGPRNVILDPSLVIRSSTLRRPQPMGTDVPSHLKANSTKRVPPPRKGD